MEEKLVGEMSEKGYSDVTPSFSSEDPQIDPDGHRSSSHPPEHELETARQFVGSLKGNSDRKVLSLLMQLGMLIKGEQGISDSDPNLQKADENVGFAIQTMKRRVSNVECSALT